MKNLKIFSRLIILLLFNRKRLKSFLKKKLWLEKKIVLKLEHVIRPLGGFSEKGRKSRQNEIIIYFQQFYKEIF